MANHSTVNKELLYETEDWYLCYANFFEETRKEMAIEEKVIIADCTLRDGEQQAGVVFTCEDKIAIAKQLDLLGVGEIEVGKPASTESDAKAAREIVKLNLKSKASALARATKSDIDLLEDIGITVANVSLPIGDLQRKYKLRWDDDRYINTCLEICEYAKSKGMYVNLSPYDTTRCDMTFLDKVLNTMKQSGYVDRFRLVDTVGSATPPAIRYLVRHMTAILGETPVEIHCHDEFGMGMANTVAGVEAGANVVSSTVGGVGGRTGNVATEEVALTLQLLYGIDLGIDCSLLMETCKLVSRLSGVPIHGHKSIVGRNCFAHEAGMSVAGLLSMPFTSEAYKPELVGQSRQIILGKKSGKATIEYKLDEMKIPYTAEQVASLLTMVKDFSLAHKRQVEDDEFSDMGKSVIKQ